MICSDVKLGCRVFLILSLIGLSSTLHAQKITLEPGMGLGFGILTSGGATADGGNGSMGVALQIGLRYHIDSQRSLGLKVLAQDIITSGVGDMAEQVTFFSENNSTRLFSVNGRYDFNERGRDNFFFAGLGLGFNRNRHYIRVNDVEKIGKSGFSFIPEVGYQAKGLQFVLSFSTPAPTPSFDQVGNDDGIRYLMERGHVATLQYSLRYQFSLFNKK
jgi:hypothetical protein